MKLIVEHIEDVQYLTESDDNGNKTLYIEGIFMQAEKKNRNGRVYPLHILEKEVNRYMLENVKKNRAYGELNHPANPTINLDRVSHMITSLRREGNDFIGKAKIVDTPNGNIARTLIEAGANLGASSRGVGNLKMEEGTNVVCDDYRLISAADIVADPSASDAFVQGIMEAQEFWINPKTGDIERIEGMRAKMLNMSAKELESKKLQLFESYIRSL